MNRYNACSKENITFDYYHLYKTNQLIITDEYIAISLMHIGKVII